MSNYKTPGVYIQELNAFGNQVVPVPTAIPAFVGYTQKITHEGKDLVNTCVRINSLNEFETIFGSGLPRVPFALTQVSDEETRSPDLTIGEDAYMLKPTKVSYRLHLAMRFFYQNGGDTCYIVSVGGYDADASRLTSVTPFETALTLLEKEPDPTLIVIPDAVALADETQEKWEDRYALCYILQSQMINHCGELGSRVAILDIPGGYETSIIGTSAVEGFRNHVEPTLSKFNGYAAAYYPWLHTSLQEFAEVSPVNIAQKSHDIVTQWLEAEFIDDPKMKPYIAALFAAQPAADGITPEQADQVLKNRSGRYKQLLTAVLKQYNLMPPSAAMAGIYTTVDNNEGVWKAPANVAMGLVIAPAVKINSSEQEDLNVPVDGKSICAIRSFPGMGVLVWGARTLDGNSLDWRYINVRRTCIFLEQSIKNALSNFVFAPNDAATWNEVQQSVSKFLTDVWNQGGLVGAGPEDAFHVAVGLGSTMTQDDITQGRMLVSVKVAVQHPAEFMEFTLMQEMSKG